MPVGGFQVPVGGILSASRGDSKSMINNNL